MVKVGQFIYPWGNGHFSRMMALDSNLTREISDYEPHYVSKGEIYQKLLQKFPQKKEHIHEILMPTPIDGKNGPSVTLSMLNLLLPISDNPPLVWQVSSCLKSEARLYNEQKFDLVINDGDMGSNVLAKNRNINCIFVTNQFRPKLWRSHFYFYPSMLFISKQIAKATKIVVADSPPPYTICEYNLNFTKELKDKIVYAGHFSNHIEIQQEPKSDLEKLLEKSDSFGYWMKTGNRSTKQVTGKKYQQAFRSNNMQNQRRLLSHAEHDSSLDKVKGKDGKIYSISEAYEKDVDWLQIDVGFLSEQEKNTVLDKCKYAVINGSHTAMGEIIGVKSKPIIGIPVYDEHTNQIMWAQERDLGILAKDTKHLAMGVNQILDNYSKYEDSLLEFSKHFERNGAYNTAKIATQMLD